MSEFGTTAKACRCVRRPPAQQLGGAAASQGAPITSAMRMCMSAVLNTCSKRMNVRMQASGAAAGGAGRLLGGTYSTHAYTPQQAASRPLSMTASTTAALAPALTIKGGSVSTTPGAVATPRAATGNSVFALQEGGLDACAASLLRTALIFIPGVCVCMWCCILRASSHMCDLCVCMCVSQRSRLSPLFLQDVGLDACKLSCFHLSAACACACLCIWGGGGGGGGGARPDEASNQAAYMCYCALACAGTHTYTHTHTHTHRPWVARMAAHQGGDGGTPVRGMVALAVRRGWGMWARSWLGSLWAS